MGNLQSNPSSSTKTTEKKYDVFLNFRGEDTRAGFTSYLHQALLGKSIQTFMDDDGIRTGDVIASELKKAIKGSTISVVIFSKQYASSKWCLRELAQIMECRKKKGQIVIPVFYQVEVSDVKAFKEKLRKQKWIQALDEATHVKGFRYHVKGPEPEFEVINKIVEDISEKLMGANCKVSPPDFKRWFGLEKPFEEVMSLLSLANNDVRIIGIWGMGGIGKTTIAEAIFDQILKNDEYGKSKIRNVRERLQRSGGLVSELQQEVLRDVLNDRKIELKSETLPPGIKERLCRKKVFIFLDDVDDSFMLRELAGGLDQFGSGSRILITTRDFRVLLNCGVNNVYIYKVKGLSYQEGLQLFNEYAQPTEDCQGLSREIVRSMNGNPLGLKVVGSFLLGSNKQQWQSALSRLKIKNKIMDVLRISYDGLERDEKEIFLDIACFFVGEDKDYVTEILGNCSKTMDVLFEKSLITKSCWESIQMHDLLQEMGMEIVRTMDPNNPGNRRWLWTQEDILDIDKLKKGHETNAVKGIFLDTHQMNVEHLSSQLFEKMTNLMFLCVHGSPFPNGISYLPYKLSSLNWVGYPLTALPSNFDPKYLVELNLSYSNIKKLWENNMRAPYLKWIILEGCPYLVQVLDLLIAPKLEKVEIKDCENLSSLASLNEFGSLTSLHLSKCNNLTWIPDLNAPLLKIIDIQYCKNLLGFPSPAHRFQNLRELNLSGCNNLQSFPHEISFPSLVSLDLSECTKLARISNVLDAPSLEEIILFGCQSLVEFPRPAKHFNKLCSINLENCWSLLYFPAPNPHSDNLCNIDFPSLTTFEFDESCQLEEFPRISGNIQYLIIRQAFINEVPSSIQKLPELLELDLAECSLLKRISSSIWNLKALRKLNLSRCSGLKHFPEISDTMGGSLCSLDLSGTGIDKVPLSIGNLIGLTMLNLQGCSRLKHIPLSICKLKALTKLNLDYCSALKCFPRIMDTMGSLKSLDLSSTGIKRLHHSIENLSGLEILRLRRCFCLEEVSSSIENLTELIQLDLVGCRSLKRISFNICKLKALRELDLSNCSALEHFPEIPDTMESLKFLYLSGTAIKGLHHSIENLSGLERLCLWECKNLEMLPISLYNLTSLDFLILFSWSKLENWPGNSVTNLLDCGDQQQLNLLFADLVNAIYTSLFVCPLMRQRVSTFWNSIYASVPIWQRTEVKYQVG